ncbi:hypothetical protein NWP96_02145 [Mycoplasmopsis cynos]|nr:hypothetical protein [Mycoplasmopsis cynos]
MCNTKQSQDTNIRPNANNLKTEKIALKALLEGITRSKIQEIHYPMKLIKQIQKKWLKILKAKFNQ